MTLAQVLQLINSNIIPNNNNEITANVLRPILVEMLQQPNDLIGLLSNLTTSANTNLVEAINELKSDIDQLNNIAIYQGIGDPNLNVALVPNIADFYSQLSVGGSPIDLWIYNGLEWVNLGKGIQTVNGKSGTDVIITIDDIPNLRDEFVSYISQSPTTIQQQTARDNIDVYSKTEVIDAISTATAPKTKGFFEHILTAGDIANTIMDFALPNTPDPNEWDFLYINSGAVSPLTYTVNGNILSIDTTKLAYPVQAGRRVTFRYMY